MITNLKNDLTKLSIVLMIGALMSFGFKANALCTAGFTFSTNPANNGSVYFTNTSSSNNSLYYSWSFGDGGTDYTANPTHVYNGTGTYNVCLTIYDSLGLYDSTGMLGGCYNTFCATIAIVNNNPSPCNASFTMLLDTLNGSNTTYTASNSSTGTSLNYFWNFGDGTSSSIQNPTHTFGATGTHTICLTVTSSVDTTCNSTYCQTITSGNPAGNCYAAFQLTPDSTNANTYIATNYSSGNSLNYFWDFGDGITSTLMNPTHTFSANGAYTICLTVVSSVDTTCYNTYCDYITIGNNAGPCTANFIMYPDSANGAGTTYIAYNYSTGTSLNYFWNFGDGTTSAIQNPSHTFASNGTYSVCLTVSSSVDSTCYNTSCQTITIGGNPASGCSASFQILQDSTNASNFYLYMSSNNNNLNYSWDFGDGTSSTQQYPTHTYNGSGPYMVCLTVSDGNGCTNTYCDSLYAGRASGGITLTVVNPTTAGVYDGGIIISSLLNYPNPFNNSTTIAYSIKQDASVELKVLDLLGNKVAVIESGNKASGTYQTEWNASNIAAGIYMLQLKVGNQISTKKLMITK